MAKKPLLLTITGPSGSGKSTLAKELTSRVPFTNLVSHTTRNPREGEINGQDYFFVSKEEFDKLIDTDGFVEHVEFAGKQYGISKSQVEHNTQEGLIPVLVVEPKGLHQIDEYCRKSGVRLISVFLTGNLNVLIMRLLTRDALGREMDEAKINYLATRLSSLVNRETLWYNAFPYSKYITSYVEANKEEVLESVLELFHTGGKKHG